MKYNRILVMSILSIWSWSLLQFTMVLTATKARRDQSQCVDKPHSGSPPDGCCTPDVYGIIVSILMQDAPFLVLRMLLIFHYGVLSYTNMFFTCKNTLVIALLMYRLIVVNMERRKALKLHRLQGDASDPYNMTESNSKARLMMHSNSTDPFFCDKFSSDAKVSLREPMDDPNEVPVEYVIKRHISQPDVNVGLSETAKRPDKDGKAQETRNGRLMTPQIALSLLRDADPPPYGMYAESEYTQSEYDNTEDFSSHV